MTYASAGSSGGTSASARYARSSSSVAVIGSAGAHHMSVIVHPPSTTTCVPVMKLASVLRRKRAVLPISDGLPEPAHRRGGREAVVQVADVGQHRASR